MTFEATEKPVPRQVRVLRRRSELRRQAEALMEAMRSGTTTGIEDIVVDAFRSDGSVFDVVSQLVDATRWQLEEMWYRGDLGILEARRLMRQIEEAVAAVAVPVAIRRPRRRRCAVVAYDDIGARTTTALLEEDGWYVVHYEPENMVGELKEQGRPTPRLVVLVVRRARDVARTNSLVAVLHALGSRVLVVEPGRWLGSDWHVSGADAHAQNASTTLLLSKALYYS